MDIFVIMCARLCSCFVNVYHLGGITVVDNGIPASQYHPS